MGIDLLQFLRDNAWAGIAALSGGAFGIYQLRRQRRLKELTFGLLLMRDLVAVDSSLAHRLEIRLDGTAVSRPRILLLVLKNTGNETIHVSDFAEPAKIVIGSSSSGKIIFAEVDQQEPSNLGTTLAMSENTIIVSPLLLNPGDSSFIRVLYSGAKPEVTCHIRIAGIRNVAPIAATGGMSRAARVWDFLLDLGLLFFCCLGFVMALIGGPGGAANLSEPLPEPLRAIFFVLTPLMIGITANKWYVDIVRKPRRRRVELPRDDGDK